MSKQKRTRVTNAVKVIVLPANHGTNTPAQIADKLDDGKAAWYKQAENPLRDSHKK